MCNGCGSECVVSNPTVLNALAQYGIFILFVAAVAFGFIKLWQKKRRCKK